MPEARTASPTALRIVLFGMPDAGKSSLLGALVQAAQVQERVLNGRLTDLSHGLAELQHRLYDDAPRQTVEEVLPYPVVFETFNPRQRLDAVLYDCDGRVANDLLARRKPMSDGNYGALENAILAADTLVLAVDASAGSALLERDFAEFARFLNLLEHSRGQRTDVGGLPVFLVLTKCDLLAQPDEEMTAWVDRIEEKKQQVGERFQAFLARQAKTASLPFGSIELHLWSTAVKRPALRDSPAKPREPYGVAELFRLCFEQAQIHRARHGRSHRRLWWTVAATIVAVAVPAGLASMLFVNRPSERTSALELQVDHFKASQFELSPLGRHKNVQNKIADLTRITHDPSFADLAETKRDFVANALTELKAYQEFDKKLDAIPSPKDARNESQLQSVKERLTALTMPAEYETDWTQTDAGRRRLENLEEVSAIESACRAALAAYQKLLRNGNDVLARKEEPNLPRRAKNVLDQALGVPKPDSDRDRLIPGGKQTTYAAVFAFPNIEEVLRQWDELKRKLEPFARLEQS